MRRLPHLATLLRPSTVVDEYGDDVAGPLAPVGSPLPAWLQTQSSTEVTDDGMTVVVTRTRLHVRLPAPALVDTDVVEVAGLRYAVKGDPAYPVNPRGRGRFVVADVHAVTRGG